MTVEPITSQNELKNIIALGLDLWVVTISSGSRTDVWCLTRPRMSMRARGPALGSPIITDEYLVRWSIKDHDCHHTVHTYGHPRMYLFNTKQEADKYAVQKFNYRPSW